MHPAPLALLQLSHVPDHSQRIILSPTLQPIPAHLVRWILAGDFVKMRDLLLDKTALHNQLEAVSGPLSMQSILCAL